MDRRGLLCVAAATLLATGCGAEPPVEPSTALGDGAVTVGSFNFAESELLAELYAQALEAAGIPVVRELDLGPRELVEPAIEKGLIELVPEYAGSLLEFLLDGSASADLARTRRELGVELERRGLVALASSQAQSRNGFAVTEELADELDLTKLSDLADQPGLVLGGPPECPQRPLCQAGLEETYGLDFEAFVPLDQSGPLTSEALLRGVVDVALVFTSSAEIVGHGFVLLEDDRHLQPAEHVTPVVHVDAFERFGRELGDAIDAVSALLTTQELRALNAEIQIDGRSPSAVARGWLVARGFAADEG